MAKFTEIYMIMELCDSDLKKLCRQTASNYASREGLCLEPAEHNILAIRCNIQVMVSWSARAVQGLAYSFFGNYLRATTKTFRVRSPRQMPGVRPQRSVASPAKMLTRGKCEIHTKGGMKL